MAIYRNIQMSFWTDPKVSDDYTPKDKLFYLYVLTNTHTNLCGCYEVSIKQMSYEIGYSTKEIDELVERAENLHQTIAYSRETKELLVLHWSKYNWTSSKKFRVPLEKEIKQIKDQDFKEYLTDLYNGIDTVYEKEDTVSQSERYRTDTTVTVTVPNINKNIDITNRVIDYLNNKCNTRYKANREETKKHINARLEEGYTEEDFYTVIDNKCSEWLGTEWEKYLRPDTLFSKKFENYLNQKTGFVDQKQMEMEAWANEEN